MARGVCTPCRPRRGSGRAARLKTDCSPSCRHRQSLATIRRLRSSRRLGLHSTKRPSGASIFQRVVSPAPDRLTFSMKPGSEIGPELKTRSTGASTSMDLRTLPIALFFRPPPQVQGMFRLDRGRAGRPAPPRIWTNGARRPIFSRS